ELRSRHCRCVSAARNLRWPYPQGRKACGFAGRAVEQVRTRHQRLDRQDARPHRPGQAARHRRRGDRMNRRAFISLLGGAAAAWPLAARAQEPMALVGLLTGADLDDRRIGAIRQGLKDVGYIEGRNVAIKYRSGDGRFDRLPAMAAELAADAPAAIIALAPAAALAA